MRIRKQNPESLARTLGVVMETLAAVGLERIGSVTLTPHRISLEPRDLAEGEQIARTLGCTLPMDHRMLTPGFTDWSGQVAGLEVHVRSVLRRPLGGAR
ncbi:hypothetical protein [Myceligenerans indicum]|uniref:Uncharacterized protein n=1 Tax=Myceligenerans indicum TaxID=2593663 RepID=A0ABS1LJ27_9MICO|nr:hypothetical protein [Myceligenerans indicum]MBL0886201.1 hypothetical protein [Myceligenerans indicum]